MSTISFMCLLERIYFSTSFLLVSHNFFTQSFSTFKASPSLETSFFNFTASRTLLSLSRDTFRYFFSVSSFWAFKPSHFAKDAWREASHLPSLPPIQHIFSPTPPALQPAPPHRSLGHTS